MNKKQDLPDNWCWANLETLSMRIGDVDHKMPLPISAGIPYISTKNFQGENEIDFDAAKQISHEDFVALSRKIKPEKRDILLSRYGTIGEVREVKVSTDFQASYSIAIIKMLPQFNLGRYLLFALRSSVIQKQIKQFARATAQPDLGLEHIRLLKIPLAPLPEQQRIVEAIEQQFSCLDEGVALLLQAQKRLKLYRASVLKAAVEGKLTKEWRKAHPDVEPASALLQRILAERRVKWEEEQVAKGRDPKKAKYEEPAGPDMHSLPALPEGWCWATVGQMIISLRNGLPQKPNPEPPGYPVLRISAVRPMKVNLDEVRYLPLPDADVQNYFIENGDLLFTRYNGSIELLGVGGVVKNCSRPTLHPDKLMRVKTAIDGTFPAFLEIACNAGISRAFIESRARTTAGQTGVSGSDIKQTPFPLPPIAEQAQIVALVEERLSIISELEAAIEKGQRQAERQRQSILRKAFSGKLVPQNPEDEPAGVLLERIRQEREQEKSKERPKATKVGASGSRRPASAAQTSWLPDRPIEFIDSANIAQESLWQEAEETDIAVFVDDARNNNVSGEKERDGWQNVVIQAGKQK